MSKNQSNPILESLLLALMVHVVILAVIYFSDDALRSNANPPIPAQVEMDLIELTDDLLEIPEETQPAIESILDKYKNVTANANDVKTNVVANSFNKSQVDQEVLEELLNMEKEEFEKLKDDGVIPEDLTQSELQDPTKESKDPEPNDSGSKSGESYSAATSVFDFSRNPEKRKNPTYKCISFGQIVVEISVDKNGKVTSAQAISGDLEKDCLKSESEAYARRWKFAAKFDAPKSEKGTITFTFMPQ